MTGWPAAGIVRTDALGTLEHRVAVDGPILVRRVAASSSTARAAVAAAARAQMASPPPGCIRIREVVEDPDAVVLVQDGGGVRVADEPALWTARGGERARTVLLAAAQAIAALHRSGFAHGAIGPGTILVTGDTALLLEPGLLAAARGNLPAPWSDVEAWRGVADLVGAGLADRAWRGLLEAAVEATRAGGLDAACAVLAAGLPDGAGADQRPGLRWAAPAQADDAPRVRWQPPV